MIDLGKSKEITAVLKLKTQFSQKRIFSKHSISVCGLKHLSNDICQTLWTFIGLKLYLGRNVCNTPDF